MKQEFLKVVDVTKTFGTVVANNHVNLSVNKGEILAILGENGSGKSTLMNVISGLYAPDSGQIYIEGQHVKIHSPQEAIQLGIGMIHQHFKLIDALSACDNIIGGMPGGLLAPRRAAAREISALCERYGFQMKPQKRICNMSISEKQTVEIVKALYRGAALLILDEPTAVLTPQETGRLFSILREMKKEGCSIIIITHKLSEVLEISDRVSIFRKGESVAEIETAATNAQELTELMVGRAVEMNIAHPPVPPDTKTVAEIQDLTVVDREKKKRLNGVTLTLRAHEILGIAGIAGSGQKELCEAIVGMQKATGSIRFLGQEILGMTPGQIMRAGFNIGFVPEDRLGTGLVGDLDLTQNVMLKSYRQTKGMFLDTVSGKDTAARIVAEYHVSTPGTSQLIKRLSGGNIQKVLLGREIDHDPALLIAAYPVRGLDIAASYFVYNQLNAQKKRGAAVLLIGEDLDVLLQLCDRIAVLHDGKLMGVVSAGSVTKQELGLMMTGQTVEGAVRA